jgi:hypothetical protein
LLGELHWETERNCGTINHICEHCSLLSSHCLYVDQKANHQCLSIIVSPEETIVKVWLLIALFVAAGPTVVKAGTTDRQSPVDQGRIAYHKRSAAVSAPTVVATVRSAGLAPATLPVKIGSTYVMHAVDLRGTLFRVELAANSGEILAVRLAAGTKRDDVSKSSTHSRARAKLAASSAATVPSLTDARRRPAARVGSPPMPILPKIAATRHKLASGEATAAPPIRLASNEHVEPRVPATLLGTLRAVGLTLATAPVKVEPTYVVQAINQRGMTLRVLLAANSGDILAIQPTRGAPRHEHHDGDALGATDSARPGAPMTPTEPHLVAGAPPVPSDVSFIAP